MTNCSDYERSAGNRISGSRRTWGLPWSPGARQALWNPNATAHEQEEPQPRAADDQEERSEVTPRGAVLLATQFGDRLLQGEQFADDPRLQADQRGDAGAYDGVWDVHSGLV